MNRKARYILIIIAAIFLSNCANSQQIPFNSPIRTQAQLDDLLSTLSNSNASARVIVEALYDLEKSKTPITEALPLLIRLLRHDDPEVRAVAIHVIGSMGNSAACAVPQLAERLWDLSAFVRTASAVSIDYITAIDLVDSYLKFEPLGRGFLYDEPEGRLTGKARDWWKSKGQFQDWSSQKNYCKAQS